MVKSLKRENSELVEKNSRFVQLLKENQISVQDLSKKIKDLEVILCLLTKQLLNSELNGRLQVAEDETSKISIHKVLADLEEAKKEKENYMQTINKMEDDNLILKQDHSTIKVLNHSNPSVFRIANENKT